MTKPQLAVGLSQLAKVDRVIELRIERFTRMQELLSDVEELILPAGVHPGHACHLYVVRLDTGKAAFSRDVFRTELREGYGVETSVHYPAVWSWEALAEVDYDRSDCGVAEKVCEQVLSLPIFPTTPLDDLEYVKEALKGAVARLRHKGA
jgi:dTDP-4-amino-4,6-dideoxygalactose transaminase